MQGNNKPLPPFGTILEQYLKNGIVIKAPIYIFCGKYGYAETKKYLTSGNIAICLPYQANPQDFRWSLPFLNCVLYDTGGMAEIDLLKAIDVFLSANAQSVCVFSPLQPVRIFQKGI